MNFFVFIDCGGFLKDGNAMNVQNALIRLLQMSVDFCVCTMRFELVFAFSS